MAWDGHRVVAGKPKTARTLEPIRGGLMTRLHFIPAFLTLVTLSTAGCLVEPGADPSADAATEGEAVAETEDPLTIKRTPDSGESCHSVGGGVTNGTMTNDGWCCGVTTCNDKQTCGDDYGHKVPSCVACDWYKCDPGSTPLTNPKPPWTRPLPPIGDLKDLVLSPK
jgi:hypothetical protein